MWGQAKNVAFLWNTFSWPDGEPITQTYAVLPLADICFSAFLSFPASRVICPALSRCQLLYCAGWLTDSGSLWAGDKDKMKMEGNVRSLKPESQVLSPLWKSGRKQTPQVCFLLCFFFFFFFFLQKSLTLCIYAACACACFCLCLREIYIVIFPIRANTFCCLLVYCCLASCILFWEICLYPFFAKQRISTISNLCMLNVNIK